MQVYDLSVPLNDRTPIFPNDPLYSAQRFFDCDKDGVNELKLTIGTHTGTHVDVPLHHIPSGQDVSVFPVETFIGPALVASVDKSAGEMISTKDLEPIEVRAGDILVVSTGWEDHLYEETYFKGFPAFHTDVAGFLAEKQVKALGTDTPSVDPIGGEGAFHRLALTQGIGLIEALVNLRHLRGERVFLCAAPLKIESGDGSPVRAVAIKGPTGL